MRILIPLLLQASMTLRQSVGIIGGKPNHAHWFIGYVGEWAAFKLLSN